MSGSTLDSDRFPQETSDPRGTERRRIPWRLVWAHTVLALWSFTSKLGIGVIYLAVISEGLRIVIPPLGQKLHKLPGLTGLKVYEGTYKLDLASIFSLFLLLAVWVCWERILRLWLGLPTGTEAATESAQYRWLIVGLGGVLLATDAGLFYAAMAEMSWGSTQAISYGAVMATAAYVTVLIFITFISISLRERVRAQQEQVR